MTPKEHQLLTDMYVALGRIEAKLDDTRQDVARNSQNIDNLTAFQNNAKGGMRLIVWVAGLGGAATAALAWFRDHIPLLSS